MKDMKIVGKESLVQFLKEYRDSLQEVVDTYAETLEGFKWYKSEENDLRSKPPHREIAGAAVFDLSPKYHRDSCQ